MVDFPAPFSPIKPKTEPFFKGFLEGYLTMDALAALNFGIIVSLNIRGLGIHCSRRVVHYSILVGVYAGLILAVVYVMLAWLGSCASGTFPRSENGAVTLSNLSPIFGDCRGQLS